MDVILLLTCYKNIAKAQAEIDRLEAEAEESTAPSSSKPTSRRTHDIGKKPSIANQSANGHTSAGAELAQEKDADLAEDFKEVTLEDKSDD